MRNLAIFDNKDRIVRFNDRIMTVSDNRGNNIFKRKVPTLNNVNYDTTQGKDMIIFTGYGTGKYNIEIHGGDITLRSWLGFEKSLAINCTGLVTEGKMVQDDI